MSNAAHLTGSICFISWYWRLNPESMLGTHTLSPLALFYYFFSEVIQNINFECATEARVSYASKCVPNIYA